MAAFVCSLSKTNWARPGEERLTSALGLLILIGGRMGATKKGLYCFWLLIAFAPGMAMAQEGAQAEAAPEITPQVKALDEVVVTASKRQESLQDTLGSVTAVSGDALQRNNVQDFNSLVELVPGMVAQDEDKIAIRGISRTRDGPSPVAFHVNDVFIATRGAPFYDLEAVEILRGPSGTVFGRNATAGAINAKWRKPEDEWAAGGVLRVSSRQEKQLKAYANIPFIGPGNEALLGRFAAGVRRDEGTLDNLLAGKGRDPGYAEDQFIRMYLTSAAADNIQLSLRAIHFDSKGGGNYVVASPSLATRRSGVLEEAGAMPLPDDLTKVRTKVSDTHGEGFLNFTRVDGDVTWSLENLAVFGDVDVVLVAGIMAGENSNVFDLDGTEEVLTEGVNTIRDDVRRTAELRFLSQNDSGIDWLLGLFWYKQTATGALDIVARAYADPSDLGVGPAFPGEPEFPVNAAITTRGEKVVDESVALFLNMDFNLAELFGLPQIQITTGLRQNRDRFGKNTDSNDIIITEHTVGLGPIPAVQQTDLVQEASFNATTGELAARWFYHEDGMAYAKVSRGYKPGLAQRVDRADGVSIQNPVDPEFLTALELGWKASFFEGNLTAAAAAYYYDYQDLQVSQITPGGVLTENAAAATIKGIEFEARWAPTQNIYLQASGAWTDATYDSYCGNDSALGDDVPVYAGCTAENPKDFSGARMTAAPKFSAAMLASYTLPLNKFGALTTTLKTSWSDKMDRRGLDHPADVVAAHSSTDVRLTWESPAQRWSLEAFVENIENNGDIFFQGYTPIIQGRPNTFSLLNNIPQRLIGVSLETRF